MKFSREGKFFSLNDPEPSKYLHRKKNKPQHLPYHTHKIHLTWIVDPNVKAKTIKCLEDMR